MGKKPTGRSDVIFANTPEQRHCKAVHCGGLKVPQVLDAFLRIMRLDEAVEKAVSLMAVAEGDSCEPPV